MRKSTGFSLIEVMIAAAVLALGAVLVHESFFASLDSFNRYSDYLNISPWMDEKIWQAQDAVTRNTDVGSIERYGNLNYGNRKFNWRLEYGVVSGFERLYRINLAISPESSLVKTSFSRTVYAMQDEIKQH